MILHRCTVFLLFWWLLWVEGQGQNWNEPQEVCVPLSFLEEGHWVVGTCGQ